jgi:hypothetical protein
VPPRASAGSGRSERREGQLMVGASGGEGTHTLTCTRSSERMYACTTARLSSAARHSSSVIAWLGGAAL